MKRLAREWKNGETITKFNIFKVQNEESNENKKSIKDEFLVNWIENGSKMIARTPQWIPDYDDSLISYEPLICWVCPHALN